MMAAVRLALLLIALVAAGFIIAAHGIRAVVFLMVLAVAITVPRTRAYRWTERQLVRLTGSRRRAYTGVAVTVIAVALAVNIYPLVH